jgi:iron complex transport system permease protein
MKRRGARVLELALPLAVLALMAMVAFTVGKFPLSWSDVLRLFWVKATGAPHAMPASVETVVFGIRGPRIAGAILVGAALAAAGAAYQGLFRNPLVSPDILGVSSGAAPGAILGIFLSLPVFAIQGFAFVGGIIAVALVYFVGSTIRGHDPVLVLVLAGVVLGTLFGAGVALLKYLADPYNQLPAITFWLLGSLAGANAADIRAAWVPMLVGLIPLYLLRWRMNVMSLGEEEAQALGVNTQRTRLAVVGAATLMTATAVAMAGVIGWVGLLIPHVARLLVGPDFTRLLPVAMLIGAAFLLAVDTLARTLTVIEIPLGMLTAFLGTPVFIWLLAATRRGWT